MPNTGRNKYEMINDNESTEEYIPMRRSEIEDFANHENDTLLGKTAGGKELYLCKHPNNAGYYFKFGLGGQLPKTLEGLWTSFHLANQQGATYLSHDAQQAERAKEKVKEDK